VPIAIASTTPATHEFVFADTIDHGKQHLTSINNYQFHTNALILFPLKAYFHDHQAVIRHNYYSSSSSPNCNYTFNNSLKKV